jgi:hypothetical protein
MPIILQCLLIATQSGRVALRERRGTIIWRARQQSISRALSTVIGSYALPARRRSSARNSRTLIPIARAVVSARLSFGPRSTPQAASQEANKSAGDSPGTVGLGTLAIAFSTRSIRNLSVLCMSAWPPAGSCRQRSSAHPNLPFLDDPSVRGDELEVDDHGWGGGCQASFEPFHPPSESPRHPSIHDSASLQRRARRVRKTSAICRLFPRAWTRGRGGRTSNGNPPASNRRRRRSSRTSAGLGP